MNERKLLVGLIGANIQELLCQASLWTLSGRLALMDLSSH